MADKSESRWVGLTIAQIEYLQSILPDSRVEVPSGLEEALTEALKDRTPDDLLAMEAARDRHAIGSDDEIEVDDNAIVSWGEDGPFVMGWLFVPAEDDAEDEDNE